MKKIIAFLEENNIDYESVTYGNPYYYNDGFQVPAITVKFDYELAESIPELKKKEKLFQQFMKRKKTHCIGYSGRCGICIPWYSIFSVFDFRRQQEHESRIHADVEKFWKEEHARREALKFETAV